VSLTRISVGGERGYDVVVGHGALAELPALVGGQVRAVLLIHPVSLAGLAESARLALTRAGYAVHTGEIPDGEAAKIWPGSPPRRGCAASG